ncbi:hypothetical protein CCP2SC5_370006 [Azospirillaceae bacterium]
MNRIPAKNILLIADSCYSGSFTKEHKISNAEKSLDPAALRERRSVMALSSGGDEPVMYGEVNCKRSPVPTLSNAI